MRHWVLLGLSALFFVSTSFGQLAEKAAHADIYNAKGEKIGTATLHEAQGGVKIDVEVTQLPPGQHALHVHAVGKCEAPDFKSAGPHSVDWYPWSNEAFEKARKENKPIFLSIGYLFRSKL